MENNNNSVSIEWESTGYSVLKNLNSSVLGIFCEFIDNSIQSYREKKNVIEEYENDYVLQIKIDYDGNEITIADNAGGINEKNFERALKPANRADDTSGLNEFGLGMKYAAVWISNEWELITTAINEEVERRVIFNYADVVSGNLKSLPYYERYVGSDKHYTIVKLRKLESKHVVPWQEKNLKRQIAFIYRNFIRPQSTFFNQWKEDYIELSVFKEVLKWEEYGFLKAQYYEDRQINFTDTPEIEWKYKFDWTKVPYVDEVIDGDGNKIKKEVEIEISGFIGILPDGQHSGKNGFVLFRRGRVVEGVDKRIYPKEISGTQPRAFKHIRLYGELHFRNVEISFDKTKLSINRERRNDIFQVISGFIKNTKFDEIPQKKFNMIRQANMHRANFSRPTVKKAIDNLVSENKKVKSDFDLTLEKELSQKTYDDNYERQINSSTTSEKLIEKMSSQYPSITIGNKEYDIELHFTEENTLYKVNGNPKDEKRIIISIGTSHEIFINQPSFLEKPLFPFLINILLTLAVSEVKASCGLDRSRDLRYAFNDFSRLFLK